ncbi:MAG: TlpA disulfide reductase family protein [Porphyromonadaceae bacterium]|nr:TlpA disulfide reductase family protein [Porphyromonadaceae bacterium]
MRILSVFVLLWASVATVVAQIPAFQLKDISGKSVQTEQLGAGDRPVAVSFFATWCKPCLRELEAVSEVFEEWQEETGMEFVAVSIDEGVNSLKVKPLVASRGWEFPVLLDPNSDFFRALGATMVPSIFVFDAQGKIIYKHTGYTDGGEAEIIKAVRQAKQKD